AGAVLTPLVVSLLTGRYGWRASFLGIGAVGFFWGAAWLAVVGGPPPTLFHGRPGRPAPPTVELSPAGRGLLLHSRRVVGRSGLRCACHRVSARRGGIRLEGASGHLVGDCPLHGWPSAGRAGHSAAAPEGRRLGREPRRRGPAPPVLDHGPGLGLHQYLLAFP